MKFKKVPKTKIEEVIEGLILEGPSNLEEIIELEEYRDRKITVGPVHEGMAQTIVLAILDYNEQDEGLSIQSRTPIRLFINSGGGGLEACFSIIDAIEMSKTPIHTYNVGPAYSAGGIIFIAGHKRYTFKHSSFLLHEGSSGYSADAGKFKDFSKFYEHQLDMMEEFVLEKTKISPEQYEKKRHADWWMDANEMIHYGIADEIIASF
jgi:ATP-dependent Clp protease protease subunit